MDLVHGKPVQLVADDDRKACADPPPILLPVTLVGRSFVVDAA